MTQSDPHDGSPEGTSRRDLLKAGLSGAACAGALSVGGTADAQPRPEPEEPAALLHGDLQAARTVCERSASPVADIFIASLNKVKHPGQSLQKAAERERQRFALWMKRRLWALGTMGAPEQE